jgi:hypothetical protein
MNSKTVTLKIMNNGITETIAGIEALHSKTQVNVIKILIKIWPDSMLANNLSAKLKTREK